MTESCRSPTDSGSEFSPLPSVARLARSYAWTDRSDGLPMRRREREISKLQGRLAKLLHTGKQFWCGLNKHPRNKRCMRLSPFRDAGKKGERPHVQAFQGVLTGHERVKQPEKTSRKKGRQFSPRAENRGVSNTRLMLASFVSL